MKHYILFDLDKLKKINALNDFRKINQKYLIYTKIIEVK